MRATASLMAMCAAGCRPELAAPDGRLDAPRVLAVRAVPAEARPGETVAFEALIAGPDGPVDPAPDLDWSFCLVRKPTGEENVVAAGCLRRGEVLLQEESPTSASGEVPDEACSLFGPEAPPEGRPQDADTTGGYYQPVRLALGAEVSIARLRLTCNLAGGGAEIAQTLRERHRPNENPELDGWEGLPADGLAQPGRTYDLRASWAPEAEERYAMYDPRAQAVVERREALIVSWFATAGDFAHARTEGENTWTAPEAEGAVHLWIVLRDGRGGVSWRAAEVRVRRALR